MSVTIKDIAKLAGVSHTTVSRALNDSPLISQDTKTRIKAIAETLNYTPNYNAKSLKLDRSYNIGLFFSTINEGTSSSFFYEVVKGVNSVIHNEFKLIVSGINEYENLNVINKKHFDGIIIMSQSTKDDHFIYNILDKNIPLVVLNREIKDAKVINILSDDCKGVQNAVEYLINQGHRHIALIEGKRGFNSTHERREGYIKALNINNIQINNDFIVEGKYDAVSGYRAMNQLLSLKDIPTAVFCSNDDMAIGAMKAIAEKGLIVPEDISIIGFDDNVYSQFMSPALTSIKKPIEEISIKGASYLLKLIKEKKMISETIYVPTELKIRETVKSRKI